ncbi:LOW QUALITY PROTEIN: uncharacterized protein LOC115692804 [Syzygium oleosum]|uniref:LOW QUALITY PROTEIN: uncharacterized protein LOC115692804 n=1 Tax=Syzygium oleosum TaxID=219896 RepID=UPI0024BB5DF2|nr:LOW QUALITY PROTEIN: uncharacterized protein LOC115692804 [Syzygium oleosum]
MGKHLQSKSAQLQLENHQQGCMWSILHGLKYHQWHYVKKRLPHMRQGGGRHSAGNGTTENSTNAHHTDVSPEHSNADGESLQKKRELSPATKTSVKARIKALISEEKYRRKGRHRRSSTSPAHLQSVEASSTHHPGSGSCLHRSSHDHFDMHGMQPIQKGELSQEKSKNSEQTLPQDDVLLESCTATDGLDHRAYDGTDGSDCRSGIFRDPLDRIDLDKELVLKVLQDKGSFSAQHFDGQNAVRMKMGLRRFGTSPVSSQSGEEVSAPSTSRNKEEEECSKSKLGSLGQDTPLAESNASVAVPVLFLKKQGKNQVVSSRLKNLKKKLKHVLKASRKEKHRIAMDGILDKIPRDHERSMEIKEDVIRKWKDVVSERDYSSSPRQGDPRGMKRTPSLDASLEKYCQLFESSFNREAKHSDTGTSRVGGQEKNSHREVSVRSLVRIRSLPELKSSSFRTEDSSVAILTGTPVRTLTDTNVSGRSSFDAASNQNFRLALEKLDVHVENEVDDEKVDHSEASSVGREEVQLTSVASFQDMGDSTAGERTYVDEVVIELTSMPSIKLEDTESNQRSPVLDGVESDSSAICCREPASDVLPVVDTEVHLENAEISSYQLDMDLMYVPVDLKDVELFNYVKDVLELSGFGGNESLGRWHSGGQPVDPSVYEEVEGCSMPNLESLENNEGGHYDHLILFDLINEVLVNIYQRSFGYHPRPLSSLCRVHPMPEGFRVLEEVWASISFYTSLRPELDPAMDYVTARELERHDGWMNLRFDSECVGLELEDLILDDLLEELICT